MNRSSSISTAEKAGCEKIQIRELQPGDLFSFDGETVFLFNRVKENIGCGLVCICYSSTKRWASFDRIMRDTKKVFVAPVGRFYKGEQHKF